MPAVACDRRASQTSLADSSWRRGRCGPVVARGLGWCRLRGLPRPSALRPERSDGLDNGGRSLWAYDTMTGAVSWSHVFGYIVEASPTISGGTVYVPDNGGTMHALDLATGASVWDIALSQGESIFSSPAVDDA